MTNLPKAYEPGEIERRWAQAWVDEKLFTPEVAEQYRRPTRSNFSLAIPPPNVTGSLHMGHMLEHTQIDILMRWRRMQGHRVLWLPGTDHAGIATQVVVERELARENLTRQALGREEFERRVWEWKAHSGGTIRKQMTRLGVSCDWSRERFTLDPPLYRAVLEAFLRLYKQGLIYRGRYMVNWCPRCQTALSDLETVHVQRDSKLWHIRYPLVGADVHITVATTRPETMLGDTAVAVHDEDERYRHLVGRKVLLPLMDREIPVIADAAVDREFGTGAVKVTPAHDPNDFEIARRHNLPEVDIMTDTAHISAAGGPYAGLDRLAAREKVVEDLRARGLLEGTMPHVHAVGVCDRCKTDIEPRLSTQWFCKMKPLAEPAMLVVRQGLIRIVPENWQRVYLDWMERVHDWCISRQLWWGHRIPVWHCADCASMTPARDSRVEVVEGRARAASPPERCSRCGSTRLEQDPDVLDTWFSSALWPFSTLGWPDDTEDLRRFYPTTLMNNGFDILFFWDARMIMTGLHLVPRERLEERIPFRTLYIHALVRDAEGQKMSKTRGNVLDPLVLTEQYGTDAVRFALAVQAAPGTDIPLSEDRILAARAFANKVWNAARFLFLNLAKMETAGLRLEEVASPDVRARAPFALPDGWFGLADRWIFSRLAAVTAAVNAALKDFRFHEAASSVYEFFWGEFCDWYLEWVKPQLRAEDRAAALVAWRNLVAVLETALRLLHPFMPFLTEELWHRLPQQPGAKSIALEPFPEPQQAWRDSAAEAEIAMLQEIITAARHIRAELRVDPKRPLPGELLAFDPALRRLVERNLDAVLRLATLSELRFREPAASGGPPASGFVSAGGAQFELRIAYGEAMNVTAELARLRKETDRLERDIASKQQRLADQTFRQRAPAEVVRSLEAILAERQAEYRKLRERMAQLSGN